MPNYDPNSDDYHYPPRHEPDAEIDRLRAELRDWQNSSEAYRHDAEKAETERDAMREALADLVNFAWTAVTADCEEARVNLNGKIAKARAALAPSPAGEKS